jgi:hypothetical protein
MRKTPCLELNETAHGNRLSGLGWPSAILAEGFGHEITLTNLGSLAYETDFGKLKLEGVGV